MTSMRIFVDCSYVDFSRQPTGIPRVVLKYIEEGYAWSARSQVDVVPVVSTAKGLLVVRPVPGRTVPAYMDRYYSSTTALRLIKPSSQELLNSAYELLRRAVIDESVLASPGASLQGRLEAFFCDYLAETCPIEIEEGDVLFCPAYWHDVDPTVFKRVQAAGARVVTLVHDILPVTHEKFYNSPWKYEFRRNLAAALRQSDMVMAISDYTATSLREFAARERLPAPDVWVAHNGVEGLVQEECATAIREGAYIPVGFNKPEYGVFDQEPYVMVGSVEPKKGHIPVIESFEAMWRSGLKRPLVIIGRPGWMDEDIASAITTSEFFQERLFWFQGFDDLDLCYAYLHARALIFASYAEGFGLPMVEAMHYGRPVVALRTPISEEVLGGTGHYFASFADLLRHVIALEDDGYHARALEAAEEFHWPLWSDVVPAVFDELAARWQ